MQREKSYTRAKHSRMILSMVLGFAVRRGIIPSNPVKESSRMKKPPHTPKALTTEQIAAIRLAAREWRTGEGTMGPRSDGRGQAILYMVRARGAFWSRPHPTPWLIWASVLDILAGSLLALAGWLMAPISLPWVLGLLAASVVFLAVGNAFQVAAKSLLRRRTSIPNPGQA